MDIAIEPAANGSSCRSDLQRMNTACLFEQEKTGLLHDMLRLVSSPALRPASCSLLLARADSQADSTLSASHSQQELGAAKPFHQVPGPRPLPLIGNAWRFLPGIGEFRAMDLKDQQQKFYREYGNIVKLVGIPGRRDMVFLFHPDDIEKLFRNEGPWPIRESTRSFQYYREVTRKDLFQGVGGAVAAQGEEWQRFRSQVNQPVMQPRAARRYIPAIEDAADAFLIRMHNLKDDKQEMPSDFLAELNKWALESIAAVVLDTRLGCLDPDLEPDSEPMKILTASQVIFESIYLLDVKASIWKLVSTPTWRRYVRALDLFTEVAMKYIEEAMERMKTRPKDDGRELSILEKLLLSNENPMVAVVMALDMMAAGIDTTSQSVATMLYYLAKNQDKQDKLLEEVNRVLPTASDERITAEHLNRMRYLKACIKETLRISPISLFNLRTLSKDMVFSGYHIPKGVEVLTGQTLLCGLEENYPQADRFIPERWLKGDEAHTKTHPFVYLPFGFGARMCLGRRFAELEMEMLTIKIIRQFRVEYHYGEMKFQSKVIYTPVSPLKFRLLPRT